MSDIVSKEKKSDRTSRASVFVLSRYKEMKQALSNAARENSKSSLEITSHTIHASKGKEADYVILIGLEGGKFSFPSSIDDDPLLSLVMPKLEDFPHAEERRLFYVALTRARRGVYLIANRSTPSEFAREIVAESEYSFGPLEEALNYRAICNHCKAPIITTPAGNRAICGNAPLCTSTVSQSSHLKARRVP